jgi:predicted GIY-YIG superfamily endonuclease
VKYKDKWTCERLLEEAQKYPNRTVFKKKNQYAYKKAKQLGILDGVLPIRARQSKWTKEKIAEEAKKFGSRKALKLGSKGAYNAAQRMGMLTEYNEYLPSRIGGRSTYSGQLDMNPVPETVGELYVKNYSMFRHLEQRGKIKDEFPYLSLGIESDVAANVLKESKKYNTRRDFYLNSQSSYIEAVHLGILKECSRHMNKRSAPNPLQKTRLYWYLHPEGFCYIGISSDWEVRHSQHMESSHNEYTKWIAEQQDPEYWESYVEYNDTFLPIEAPRKVMERAERIAIRMATAAGYKVVNKQHNPQYDFPSGTYSWETDEPYEAPDLKEAA